MPAVVTGFSFVIFQVKNFISIIKQAARSLKLPKTTTLNYLSVFVANRDFISFRRPETDF